MQVIDILIGAGAALLAQLVVQMSVIPRADGRRRREERWERNVLDFGDTVAVMNTERADALRDSQFKRCIATEWAAEVSAGKEPPPPDDMDAQRIANDATSDSSEATQAFLKLMDTRFTWLAQQILDFAPPQAKTAVFKKAVVSYYDAAYRAADLYRPGSPPDAGDPVDAIRQAWKDELDARVALLNQLKPLLSSGLPRTNRWRQFIAGRAARLAPPAASR